MSSVSSQTQFDGRHRGHPSVRSRVVEFDSRKLPESTSASLISEFRRPRPKRRQSSRQRHGPEPCKIPPGASAKPQHHYRCPAITNRGGFVLLGIAPIIERRDLHSV